MTFRRLITTARKRHTSSLRSVTPTPRGATSGAKVGCSRYDSPRSSLWHYMRGWQESGACRSWRARARARETTCHIGDTCFRCQPSQPTRRRSAISVSQPYELSGLRRRRRRGWEGRGGSRMPGIKSALSYYNRIMARAPRQRRPGDGAKNGVPPCHGLYDGHVVGRAAARRSLSSSSSTSARERSNGAERTSAVRKHPPRISPVRVLGEKEGVGEGKRGREKNGYRRFPEDDRLR